MINAIIEKLPMHSRHHCQDIHRNIINCYNERNAVLFAAHKGTLKGYLHCLKDMNVISELEYERLFEHFGDYKS